MKRISQLEFEEKLHMLRPDLVALEPYKTNKQAILFRCNVCGHTWSQMPDAVFRSKRCPACAGNQKLTHEEFVTRLQKVSPTIIPVGQYISSASCIRCRCLICNTEWEPVVSNLLNGSGCPKCGESNRTAGRHNAAVKRNNFALNHPDIAKEWDYEKNGKLKPEDFSAGSPAEVWWVCSSGHHYHAKICSRTQRRGGTGCPVCNFRSRTSFPEQAVYFYLKKLFPDTINNKLMIDRFAIDIFIPSIKTAIEYDGRAWHNMGEESMSRDIRKYELCKEQGITLIRLQENPNIKAIGSMCDVLIESKFAEERFIGLDRCIDELFTYLNVKGDIDSRRDEIEIKSHYFTILQENSIATLYPNIAKEWDYEKNGDLLPNMFSAGSQERVWWICKKGHHYPAVIASRVKGTGCAKCLGRNKTTEEFRDQLHKINPNIEVVGEYVNSRTQLLCRCTICNKEWLIRPNDLVNGHGCPACKSRKVAAIQRKAVICIETGEIFDCASVAAQHCGVSPTLIAACCRGEKKTGGGYHWEYCLE